MDLEFLMAGVTLLTCISNLTFMAGARFGDTNLEFSMAGVALFDMGLQFSWQAQDLVTWILNVFNFQRHVNRLCLYISVLYTTLYDDATQA